MPEVQHDASAAVSFINIAGVPGVCTPNKDPIVSTVGATFSITATPYAQVTPVLALTRSPAGNALAVSGLALNGAFVVVGRYTFTLTAGSLVRTINCYCAPASLLTTTRLGASADPVGVLTAYLRDQFQANQAALDTAMDATTTLQPYPVALDALARSYGGGR